MNPPFVSAPLPPSLSHISAQFDYQSGPNSDSTTKCSAKVALGDLSHSQRPGRRSWLSLPEEGRAQPYSYHSPASHLNAPGLHPVHYSRYATGFGTANSKAFQWSRLLSAGQKDDSLKTSSTFASQQSQPEITTPSTSTSQSSLLSALSVESLPHYALPGTASDGLQQPSISPSDDSQTTASVKQLHQPSMQSSKTPDASTDPNTQPGLGDQHYETSRPAPAYWQTTPTPHEGAAGSITLPRSYPSAERQPSRRRKISLSSPHDKLNSAPLLHRRPATSNNMAGIFHGPVSRELSGFANPAVAAADERWRRSDNSDAAACETGPDDNTRRPSNSDLMSDLNNLRRGKPSLSRPHNTQNSSPILHVRPKWSHNAAGVYTEWVCREQSGFANPTNAASRQRWGIADEREGKGRWNGLPSVNSWDKTKSHVMSFSNCFDPIGNGFGMGGRVAGMEGEEVVEEETLLSALLNDALPHASSGFGTSRGEGSGGEDIGKREEYVKPSSIGSNRSRPMSAAKYIVSRSQGGFGAGIDPDYMGVENDGKMEEQAVEARLVSRPGDGISHYPVPTGLIEASIKAQRQRTLDNETNVRISTEWGDTPGRVYYRHRVNHGNALDLRSIGRPRNSGSGELEGVRARERSGRIEDALAGKYRETSGRPGDQSELSCGEQQELHQNRRGCPCSKWTNSTGCGCGDTGGSSNERGRTITAVSLGIRNEVSASQPERRDLEQERHIKGTHLPLRVTKGNANGLRFSQARNCGFGEGNGALPRDRHEQSGNWPEYEEGDADED